MKKPLFTRQSANELTENTPPKSFFSSSRNSVEGADGKDGSNKNRWSITKRKTEEGDSKDGSSNKNRWSLANLKGGPATVDKLLKQINEENRKLEERAKKAEARADKAEKRAEKAEEKAKKAEKRATEAEAKLEKMLQNLNSIGGSSIFC